MLECNRIIFQQTFCLVCFFQLTECPIFRKAICCTPQRYSKVMSLCVQLSVGITSVWWSTEWRRRIGGWISVFLLPNYVLMIWLLVILPLNCPPQQNRPPESGTSSQQDVVVYKTEIHNLKVLQARSSADVNMQSITEVSQSILIGFRWGAGYLFINIIEKRLHLCTIARAGKSHAPTALSCTCQGFSEL